MHRSFNIIVISLYCKHHDLKVQFVHFFYQLLEAPRGFTRAMIENGNDSNDETKLSAHQILSNWF